MAVYPPSLTNEQVKRDFTDPIWARHFNIMQDEVRATEITVGVNPHIAVSDPAGRTPDYGTVTSRIQKMSRGEPMCSYRGQHLGASIVANEPFRPTLTSTEDTHEAATEVGYRIPQTGYWMLHAKVDWSPSPTSQLDVATRMVSLEFDGNDGALRHQLQEDAKNRANMTTSVTWQEHLRKGTDVSLELLSIIPVASPGAAQANVYLRAYLIRCLGEGDIRGIPDLRFTPDPPPPEPPPPPAPGPLPPVKPPPQLRISPSKEPVTVVWYEAWDEGDGLVTYDAKKPLTAYAYS